MRVDLQDVPQDRHSADVDHGFGPDGCFLADAGAETAGEDDGFHGDGSPEDDVAS
jgi:hypothetical protein